MFGTLFGKIWDLVLAYVSHPHVDMELKTESFDKRSNELRETSSEPIHITEAVYNYDFHWDCVLIIKNNSTQLVSNIEIVEKPDFIRFTNNIDKTESLQPNQKIELNCSITHSETIKGRESVRLLNSFPYFIDKIRIVLRYHNEKHRRCYTTLIYDKKGQEIKNKRKK